MAKCYNQIYLKDKGIKVDCGKCLNCLENRKREAATRMLCEMNNYINKYFVTLTYDPLKLNEKDYDENGLTKLNEKHLKAYIESLQYLQKRHYREDYKLYKNKLKYVKSGEYGETATQRAHYHLVIATNIYIERHIKNNWKYGNVLVERVKDARAVAYTTGYTDKKFKYKKQNREIKPFVKWSRGLGKEWIHEAIASGKIDAYHYYAENILYKNKLPRYFKSIIKENVMGIRPRYKKLKDWERILYNTNRKTIMINQNEYDANYWKWEKFIEIVKEEARKRDILYLNYKELKKKHGLTWEQRIYNLLYNEEYEELDEVEREFIELRKRMNEKLKIEAEAKLYRNQGRRTKAG